MFRLEINMALVTVILTALIEPYSSYQICSIDAPLCLMVESDKDHPFMGDLLISFDLFVSAPVEQLEMFAFNFIILAVMMMHYNTLLLSN